MSKSDKAPEPMDSGAPERKSGEVAANSKRECWAIKTLVTEVIDLFPETGIEYSNYDGRNAALAVRFDLSPLDDDSQIDLAALLPLMADTRIQTIDPDTTDEGFTEAVTVTMRRNPRLQDSRDSFGLAAALHVLTAEDDEPVEFEDDEGSW